MPVRILYGNYGNCEFSENSCNEKCILLKVLNEILSSFLHYHSALDNIRHMFTDRHLLNDCKLRESRRSECRILIIGGVKEFLSVFHISSSWLIFCIRGSKKAVNPLWA
jgi:hypothetical protein